MDDVVIGSFQIATSVDVASRRTAIVRLLAVVGGLATLQSECAVSDAKGKKTKKKKRRGKNSRRKIAGNGPPLDSEEAGFLARINEYRTSKGLGALSLHEQLSVAADSHSVDMARNNYFDHMNQAGARAVDRARAAGYPSDFVGENISAGRTSGADTFIGWKNSPGHNDNMLSPDYVHIGIGRAYHSGSKYGWYWTTVFGAPEPVFQDVANEQYPDKGV